MEFLGIEKREAGRFINRYNVHYRLSDGSEKVYELISRDRELRTQEDLHDCPVAAVVMMIHSEDGERMLLNREFRLAVGEWVYNFPAGLIEPGESLEQAAARELREETGLRLTAVTDVLPASYSAIGFSNEKNIALVGTAAGEFAPSTDPVEEIRAGWYTKAEVRELLRTSVFAGRTQSYCLLWSRS